MVPHSRFTLPRRSSRSRTTTRWPSEALYDKSEDTVRRTRMAAQDTGSTRQAVSACMRSVRGPEATEPPLAGRSSCRLGRYAASAALSTKAIGSRLRSTWTRVSSRPPRPPRARLLDSAGLVGDIRSSPWPQRLRSRDFSCWTCEKQRRPGRASVHKMRAARSVREL